MQIDELLSRGVDAIVPKTGLKEKMKAGKKLRIYLGVDPTGFNLHLGHTTHPGNLEIRRQGLQTENPLSVSFRRYRYVEAAGIDERHPRG